MKTVGDYKLDILEKLTFLVTRLIIVNMFNSTNLKSRTVKIQEVTYNIKMLITITNQH